jgi:hypothetical protein
MKTKNKKVFILFFLFTLSFFYNTNASNYYWVGGTGNWSDYANHWATTSGGLIFHTQTPGPFDDVLFDANSFGSTGQTVNTDTTFIYCKHMDWTGALYTPTFSFGAGVTLNIFGSLTLISNIDWQQSGTINFRSTSSGNTIISAGNTLTVISFDGAAGEWALQDDLNAYGISVIQGSFYSNNKVINCWNGFSSTSQYARAIYLGSSTVTIVNTWQMSGGSTLPTIDADSAVINVQSSGGAIFSGGNSNYHKVNFNTTANAAIYDNNSFDKLLVTGNITIFGNNASDTLFFNNPGHEIILNFNTTQTINNALLANPLPGFPILFQSSTSGNAATIYKNGSSVCLDYLLMQDIHATGGASFFAGDYSTDLGNNTGWSFTSCAPAISNVWPGDANYDLVCNNLDILNIGVAYNDTGYTRAGASLTWVAQPGLDWLSQFLSGVNAKHADCDGNGVVNAADTLAVSLNYGLTHPFRLSSANNTTSTGTDLYFDMPTGSLVPGSNVSIPINFGTTGNPANNVYGIAFTVNYDASLIQTGSMYMDYVGSWIATPLNNIHIEKDFSIGNLDMAECRINHQNVSGNGLIATLHFTVANTASGLLTLSFSNILAISNNEIQIPVNPQGGSVPTAIDELFGNENFTFYPNPVNDYLFISEKSSSGSRVKIYDCFGQLAADVAADRRKIFLGNLAQGMYMLYVFDKDMQKVLVKKFIKE